MIVAINIITDNKHETLFLQDNEDSDQEIFDYIEKKNSKSIILGLKRYFSIFDYFSEVDQQQMLQYV
jgi:hypothetical protein